MRNTLLPVTGFARIQWLWRTALLTSVALLLITRPAEAGMPSVSFTEVASLRMEVISFFLVVLLLSAGAVQWIWNMLRKDFARLPQLNYWRALGVVTLWGLLFVVVLTMISGARELMTPGAWVKNGATYKLKEEPSAQKPEREPVDEEFLARTSQLLGLSYDLKQYASENEGGLPSAQVELKTVTSHWEVPGFPGTSYIYVPSSVGSPRSRIVAYEPQVFAGSVLAVTADSQLVVLPMDELLRRVRLERAAAAASTAAAEADAEPSP